MPVCLSHHGFVRLLQHLKRYVCPWSLGSDHVSGDLRVAWVRALGQCVEPPSRPRTAGTHRPGLGFRGVRCAHSRRAWHRSFILLLWHTHGFSVLFSGKAVLFQGASCRGAGAGVAGWWERVLCWDEPVYPHIFLWEWESGSSVALLPSVASSAQGPSGFCLLSGVSGFGLRFGSLGLCLGRGLGLALGVALALALALGWALPCP